MTRIFVSHSSADQLVAAEIRDWLVSRGHEVFLSFHPLDGIEPGEPWYHRLSNELRCCGALLALISPSWIASYWCFAEWIAADVTARTAVPVTIVDWQSTPETRHIAAVAMAQGVDWRRGEGEQLKLLRALRTAQPAVTRRPKLFTLPARVNDFTGRSGDIVRLSTLVTREARTAISLVGGMGGVGKTSLALEAAHAVSDHFEDGVLFLDARGFSDKPMEPIEALVALIRQVDPSSAQIQGTTEELQVLYRSRLAGKRLLIVLDNVRDDAQIEPLLPPEPVAVIVTSRTHLTVSGGIRIHVEALLEAEAAALLRAVVGDGRSIADEDMLRLIRACGSLPIALRSAGKFLANHESWTVQDYLDELSADRWSALPEVSRVLRLSLDHLAQREPLAAEQFCRLGVFPASFDRAAVAAIWEIPERSARRSLDLLVASSLVIFDTSSRRWHLHDLYRELAFGGLDDLAHARAALVFGIHFAARLRDAQRLFGAEKQYLAGLALFDADRVNIEHGQAWSSTNCARDQEVADACLSYGECAEDILWLRLSDMTRRSWYEQSLQASALLNNPQRILRVRLQAIYHHHLTGDRAAALIEAREALVQAKELFDPGLEHTALWLVGLIDTDDAAKLERHQQTLAESEISGAKRHVGAVLHDMARLHLRRHDRALAIPAFRQALQAARSVDDVRRSVSILSELADALSKDHQLDEALKTYRTSLDLATKIGDAESAGNAVLQLAQLSNDPATRIRHVEDYKIIMSKIERKMAKDEPGVIRMIEAGLDGLDDADIAMLGNCVHKLKAKDSTGHWAYYFVLVPPWNEVEFMKSLKSEETVDLNKYGRVIASNYGENPNESSMDMLRRRFGLSP